MGLRRDKIFKIMKKTLPFLTASLATLLIGAGVAHAQDYTPLAPLPLGAGGAQLNTYTLSSYLSGAIKLLIALGAGLAVVMAVIGGTQYVASGIAPQAKNDAKERILNAFIGLALILTSYLILNSIDPNLVKFNLTLPPVGKSPSGADGGSPPAAGCPQPLTPLSGSEALALEGGASVIYTSSNAGVNQNLAKLQTEVGKLQTAIRADGGSATVNSAYRPLEYQKHFWEIVDRWVTSGLRNNTNPACAALKAQIGAEYSKHGLGTVVARPNGCAPHVKGIGVDIRITGRAYDSSLNTWLQSKGIDLTWRALSADPVHFELKNPPYSGCAQ